ncbi:MAG: type II toxin-antitoxin system YafQ family toxin [Peptoniphilaceae bacterium]|nr:type II toxin-antitoxin system YafQ family toxin [Peptoniphilaceae bacterium]MDY3075836.1 type II toxin-antitoxin system YafQ family toxin [Peptoniphilaceae bacterium]MDY4196088.1 type II toxin-antitoxin system YafQ family toxin [Peptoniphilaceae bacterium]MDY5842558.1 type II toxin-antitoxin system YafQ family toxin [Peptoniphilaceae bacterium]MDY6146930.1 type II toxin-antitoxin system YafQ family toxin [Peptoniphilaceae bacterium]
MLKVVLSNRFRKDLKLAERRGLDLRLLNDVVDLLAQEKTLPERHKDHALTGKYAAFRECHIKPDWLLIYRVEEEVLELMLFRTGSHADLFNL